MEAVMDRNYVDVRAPIDSNYISDSLCSQDTDPKSHESRISLILTSINFADVWGYTHQNLKDLVNVLEVYKFVAGAASFVSTVGEGLSSVLNYNPDSQIEVASAKIQNSFDNSPTFALAVKVADIGRKLCFNGKCFLQAANLFTYAAKISTLASIAGMGSLFLGAHSALQFADNAYEVASLSTEEAAPPTLTAPSRPLAKIKLELQSKLLTLVEKIAYVAVAAIHVMTTFLAGAVALPAVPMVVVPSLLMCAVVAGLLSKSFESAAKKVAVLPPLAQLAAVSEGVGINPATLPGAVDVRLVRGAGERRGSQDGLVATRISAIEVPGNGAALTGVQHSA